MRHLYYTLQTLLRGHGGTAEKIISLTLGLAMGVLLFAQIAYELSFDRFYPNPDTLVMLRMRDVNKGVPDYAYNYGTYRPAAADLSEAFPELVESASLTSNFWTPTFYKDDKKLEDIQTLFADTAYFATTGLTLLQGDPMDLGVQGNAFISESKARELYGDESPIGKELSVEKLFNVTIRGVYADVPRNSIMPHDLLLSMAAMDWAYGAGTWGTNNLYGVLFRLKQPTDVDAMNSRIQKAVEQYTDPHMGDDVVTEYSVLPLYKVYRSYPDSTRRLVILGVLGFSIFFVSILNYVLRAVAAMSRRAKQVGVHKCSGADGWHILSMFLWETGLLVVVSILCGGALLWLLRGQVEELLGSRLADLFTWQTLYVPLGTVLLLFLVAGVVPGRIYARIPVTQVFRRYTDGKRSWKRGLLTVQFIGVSFIGGLLLTTVWVTTACIILIVLMGLIGYVSDETQRRSKEIAVRKVNGAEASDILRLLSLDILKIAVLAVAAGMAAAWYVSGQWMQQFADSRLLSPAWYALLALLLLVLIVAIVVLKAWRIANENPVLSIKSE